MNDKVKKIYETKQEYRKAVIEYTNDIRDFFKDKPQIYNLSAKVVDGNKIHVYFNCDVSLDSNHIIDFCEKFGFNKTIWMSRSNNDTGTFSYKFCKDIPSMEVI